MHVSDHCRAIETVLVNASPGSVYNIGGNTEMTNLEICHRICDLFDDISGKPRSSRKLIEFVGDRPGHELRYSVDYTKITQELGWEPSVDFSQGLESTIQWYLEKGWRKSDW